MFFFLGLILVALSPVVLSCESDPDAILLRQSDFVSGTYVISTSNSLYCLAEDISFNPNSKATLGVTSSWSSSDPLPEQFTTAGGKYNPEAYGIGFFAAIAIAADNVILDLNGHTLEQSEEHALLQRFYANIELADRPFISGQGPHTFGSPLRAATHVTVRNGRLGRSSHHEIHGNNNRYVTLEDLDMNGFEVAGIQLNQAINVAVRRITLTSRQDVPVLGRFSQARFLRPYLDCIVNNEPGISLNVRKSSGDSTREVLSASQIRDQLKGALDNVYNDLITNNLDWIDSSTHPTEYGLFHNAAGIVDGNAYGVSIHNLGVAVNAFPSIPLTNPSRDVIIEDVTVNVLNAKINEVIILPTHSEEKPQIDAVGASLSLFFRSPLDDEVMSMTSRDPTTAEYVSNTLNNAVLLVAKAKQLGFFDTTLATCHLDVSRLSIENSTLSWAETPSAKLSDAVRPGNLYCADTMFHVNKGVVAFKLDGVVDLSVSNCNVKYSANLADLGESSLCGSSSTTIVHPLDTHAGFNGADVRGFSFSGTSSGEIDNCHVQKLWARRGSAIAYDFFGNAQNVKSTNIHAYDIHGGVYSPDDSVDIASDYTTSSTASDYSGTNRVPFAYCARLRPGTSNVNLMELHCSSPQAVSFLDDQITHGSGVDEHGNLYCNFLTRSSNADSSNNSESDSTSTAETVGLVVGLLILFLAVFAVLCGVAFAFRHKFFPSARVMDHDCQAQLGENVTISSEASMQKMVSMKSMSRLVKKDVQLPSDEDTAAAIERKNSRIIKTK